MASLSGLPFCVPDINQASCQEPDNEYRLSVSAVKLINSHLGLFELANAVNLSAAIAETGQLYGLDEVDFDQKYAKSNSTYDTFQLHVQRV